MSAKKPPKGGTKFVTSFRHWKTGELIEASKYGLKAFPIRSPKRKPK